MIEVKEILKTQWKDLQKKENVVGYSGTLKNKISGDTETDTKAIRIYVKKKKDLPSLRKEDVIPPCINGIPTDIVEIGEVKALVDKTTKVRPVELGVSVGNWNITAGSLGMLYKKDGILLAGSNAHVIVEHPEYDPSEVIEKRILQPGAYHAGQIVDNIAGTYYWHQKILPNGISGCKIGNGLSSIFNRILRLLDRNGSFKYTTQAENHIDFAAYIPDVEHISKVADDSLTNEPFIGHLFAGSDKVGIICKVKYIVEAGFEPLFQTAEVEEGDTVKGCSFWCNYETEVTDTSAAISVNYGDFNAFFTDVIITKNDGTIRGGYSGSGWRLIK